MFDIRLIAIPIGVAAILLAQVIVSLRPKYIRKKKPAPHVRGYSLAYSDKKTGTRSPDVTYSKLLVNERYGLQGKPDMILSNGRMMIPIELKSGSVGERPEPFEGDLLQLAVYFLLIEAEYGVTPQEGRLIYSDWMFIVSNTRPLRKRLLRVLREMREMLETGEHTVTPGYKKCLHCPCRDTVCEYCE